MRIRFWGTRGSLPKPGPTTLRYGGNTSCVEVWTADGVLVVLSGDDVSQQAMRNTDVAFCADHSRHLQANAKVKVVGRDGKAFSVSLQQHMAEDGVTGLGIANGTRDDL